MGPLSPERASDVVMNAVNPVSSQPPAIASIPNVASTPRPVLISRLRAT